jgi:hypothetical protein
MMGLRRDLGIQPEQDVQRARRWQRPGDAHQRLGLVGRFNRDPSDRVPRGGRSNGGPEVRVGLAYALERDPAVRDAGPAGDRPLAARNDVGVVAEVGDTGDDRRDVVGLERERAEPGIRKRRADAGRGLLECGEVRDPDRRPEPAGGEPERGCEAFERLAGVR